MSGPPRIPNWSLLARRLQAAGATLTPHGEELAGQRVECAWCRTEMAPGREPTSHGICDPCIREHFPEAARAAGAL